MCCRFSSTVEDGALSLSLRRTRPFAQYQDLVMGEKIEVNVNCELDLEAMESKGFRMPKGPGL